MGVECMAAVTARTRCGWIKFMKCGVLLCGLRFPVMLKGTVYKSYVMLAVLCDGEVWCLREYYEF